MGQILLPDSVGILSHNAGVISLTSSRVTVGGQQYNTSTLTRTISTDVTMTANTLYMIYMVIVSGVAQLRISSNVNSVGPSGFSLWKLVGAFYANGMSPVAFGALVNIDGPIVTDDINYTPTFVNLTVPTVNVARWRRVGQQLEAVGNLTATAQGSAPYAISIPQNLSLDSTKLINNSVSGAGNLVGILGNASATVDGGELVTAPATSLSNIYIASFYSSTNIHLVPNSGVGLDLNVVSTYNFTVPISNWSNTPLKDL